MSRQDALNARDLFQWDRTGSRALLDEAIAGFRTLSAQVGGPQRIEDLKELLSALSDLNDLRNEGADRLVDVGALEEIIAIVDTCIDAFEADGGSRATLLYARAAARQQIADHAEDVAGLAVAAEEYREALLLLEGVGDTSDLASEVRDGLAGALQVLGSKSQPPDVGKLQEAVDLFAISAARPLLNDSPVARGAVAFNLANAWTAYWLAVRAPGVDMTSFKQAIIWTGRAENLFMQANQPSRIAEARSLVAQLAANEPF